MKYLCLGFFNKKAMDSLSKEELDAVMSKCEPHIQELYTSDRVVFDAGLGVETTNIGTRNGKLVTTDGPFTETKEQLGNALMIEARDLNEAIQVASQHPAARMGEAFGWRLEIRPVTFFKQT